jgi:hypothetical protein
VQYNVKLGDILWLNNMAEDVVLQPGALVRVRLAPDEAPPPTPTPILYHAVRSGQTLWEIALTYGLSLEQLLALNSMDQNALIQPGELLLVRQAEPTPLPTLPPTETPLPPTPSPTQTPTTASTAVSASLSQASNFVATPDAPVATAVPATPEEAGPTVVRIVTVVLVALLVVGVVAVAILRSELL